MTPSNGSNTAFGALDWASQTHCVVVVDQTGKVIEEFQIEHVNCHIKLRLAVVLAKLCATESPTIFATGRKDSGNRLIGIPYRLAMISQWARLFTQLTTFRTMSCFGESNGSAVLVTTRAFQAIP